MDDAASMCIFERVADLLNDCEGVFLLKFSRVRRIQNVGECCTVEPFHDNEEQIIIPIEINNADNIRMRQAAAFGSFLLQRT